MNRATQIINSPELKQAICHQILGTTFKDIERAMTAVLNERQLTSSQEEEIELQNVAPHKFDPDLEFKLNKKAADPKKIDGYRILTKEDVAALFAASNTPVAPYVEVINRNYTTYTREQVQEFMREHNEYLEKEKLWKEERAKWDSRKTTELETKIETITKPSISTKD